jgi:hypothetical protein
MICVVCGELVDESRLFVGIYADIGKWETGENEDIYTSEISKYLAVMHTECLEDCQNEQLMASMVPEIREFKKRVRQSYKRNPKKAALPRLKVINGGKA